MPVVGAIAVSGSIWTVGLLRRFVQSVICARAELLIETQCWQKFKGKIVIFLFLTLPSHSFSSHSLQDQGFLAPTKKRAVEKSLDP